MIAYIKVYGLQNPTTEMKKTLIDKFENAGFVKKVLLDYFCHEELIASCEEKIQMYDALLHEFDEDLQLGAIIPQVTMRWLQEREKFAKQYFYITGKEYKKTAYDTTKIIKKEEVQD